jgi:hypothetical protein
MDTTDHPILQAGERKSFEYRLTEWPLDMPADTLLRPYVIDALGRKSSTAPISILRDLLDLGWSPPTGTPEELLIRATLLAPPVEPRWKLWRPKHEREWMLPAARPNLTAFRAAP